MAHSRQAVYNLALAGILYWAWAEDFVRFQSAILSSIVVLGVFGAFSAEFVILAAQTLPAVLALVLLEVGLKGPDDLGVLAFTLTASTAALLVGAWAKVQARNMRAASTDKSK